MKVTITFDTDNEEERSLALAILGGNVPEAAASEPDTSEADAEAEKKAAAAAKRKEAAAKKKAEEEAAKKAEEEAAAKAAEEEAEAEKDEDAPTREDVKAALKDYAALEGKEAAIGILKDHGAASITELAEDKYADVIAACGD